MRSARSWSPAESPTATWLLPSGPAGEPEAGTVLIVCPARSSTLVFPSQAGSLVYALLTGHPEQDVGELVLWPA
jgi:hypothetical protein